jgi:deoxyribodipyrimidine photo-lyase
MGTDELRVRAANARDLRRDRPWVVYWMIAARRPAHNFALDRAIGWARELRKPLVIFEPLRVDYRWASARLHRFVIDGMADNARAFHRTPALYFPYVEPSRGAGKGLLEALAASAAVVVTDDYPCFFLPAMVAAAANRLDVRLEAVDSNGILPLRASDKPYTAAAHFRRHVQKYLPRALEHFPDEVPFRRVRLPRLAALPASIARRWPAASATLLDGSESLARLAIDHSVPAAPVRGGASAARRALRRFLELHVDAYHQTSNHPDLDATSRLSPYLHFGHIGVHEIFTAVMRRARWSSRRLGPRPTGAREGWWGVGPGPESFLDELIVWRELAFNSCATRPDHYDRYESLPDWAQATLTQHLRDARNPCYAVRTLEAAATADPLWNAAQRQLLREGWFHGYLRMLWGKKILEWSATPQQALAAMTRIMDRWSLDGRDPNSYAGYLWTLGRFDRPWPERPIYGKVRSMSSTNTARKVKVERYLERYR